ncbi:MAG: FAD-binding oxidoreductase [Bacillota bacterium]|nr:FAD-binding oxidoreductase [Bacillota bacterium]
MTAAGAGRQPEVWVTPRDEEQVRELLCRATREKVPVYPRGGGTRWCAGLRPFGGGMGLDMSGFDRIEDLDPDNLTVVAGAGVSHAALQAALATHRLFLPSETAWPERSTLGGEVAVDASGPRKYAYGSTRAYLLGARVVFPDGAGGLFGGKQVKNVSGYDISRFLCGSWGSLGVITRVVIKVRPLPERRIVKVLTGAMTAVLRAAEEVRRDLYGAAAMEVLLGQAASWWCRGMGLADAGVVPPALLLVGLEGAREAVEWQSEWLEGLAARQRLVLPDWWANSPTAGGEDGGAAAAWAARRSLFDRAAEEGASVWNAAVLPASLGRLLESVLGDAGGASGGAGEEGARGPGVLGVAAHAGNGHAHIFLTGEPAPAGGEAGSGVGGETGIIGEPRELEAVGAAVRALGGYLLADDAARAGTPYEVLPPTDGLAAVWNRLKGTLDPAGIMCPAGRFGGEGA